MAAPDSPPDIDRVLDGYWLVDDAVDQYRQLVEGAAKAAEKGRPRRVRVWVTTE